MKSSYRVWNAVTLQLTALRLAADTDVEMPGRLFAKRSVADLDDAGREMRPIRIQLLRHGQALRERERRHERVAVAERPHTAERQARRAVVEARQTIRRRVLDRFDSSAERDLPRFEVELLDHEHAGRRRIDGRHECLVADRRELALAELDAERAAPPTDARVQQLDAQLGRVVREPRSDGVALELDVLVVVDAEPNVDAFDGARQILPAAS